MSRPAICPHCGAKRAPVIAPLKVGEDDRRQLHKLLKWLWNYTAADILGGTKEGSTLGARRVRNATLRQGHALAMLARLKHPPTVKSTAVAAVAEPSS